MTPSSSTERILRLLKLRGSQTTEAIARHLGITIPGARKHLVALLSSGLVDFDDAAGAVGRPKRLWRLATAAQAHFPDTHAMLAVDLIGSIRTLFGDDSLNRLIAERGRQVDSDYRRELDGITAPQARLARLTELRNEEGYMAEWANLSGGGWLLMENHCPICAAARACQGFCRYELETFRNALGEGVTVERVEHIITGARRCAYRVVPSGETTR